MKKTCVCIITFMVCICSISAKELHVSVTGSDQNNGTLAKPYKSIKKAVEFAYAGDTITVHAGVYREWINPLRGGLSNEKRIVYQAAPGEKAEIKGSEIITGWKMEKNGIWKVVIPNSFFGTYNPYKDLISGDWFNNKGRIHHTGEVFLNGKSLYEMESLEKVINPPINKKAFDPDGSTYTWFCISDSTTTTIFANFHTTNPNKALIEITTRATCFYPEKEGINFITLSGFYISQAATQWGAPTAEQVGMVATHWNKGWIIENNIISESKCSGITLGKERGTGHNVWSKDTANLNRDGNIHYIEVVFNVLRHGWNKENIGGHKVYNNTIFNCEQTGICGSMGAVFSTIEGNHIYNIWTKRQFEGAEIGGIKLHAAVDVTIKKNRIHQCGRGIWLDWMAQGTRVSSNLLYNNDSEDFFSEVNHGPVVVDNNILLSPLAFRIQSQGGAYINNLIAGAIYTWPEPNRFTPYFLPHTIDMAALTTIFSGDDRFYNNIFIGKGERQNDMADSISNPWDSNNKFKSGLAEYNNAKLPIWVEGNIYYNGASPSAKDKNFTNDQSFNPNIKLVEDGKQVFFHLTINQSFIDQKVKWITTEFLGKAKIPKAAFDNPDGSPLVIDMDYLGNKRNITTNHAGPFISLNIAENIVKVW